MNELAHLQENFHTFLLRGGQSMSRQVVSTTRASAEERLAIYESAYRLRLLDAMRTDFPALHTLAGDAAFERLGRTYIDHYPSEHPSLRWFGRHLSDFLRRTPPWRAQPVFAEMAAFEWAQGEVFDAEDAAVTGIEAIGAVPAEAWPTMRLILHPSVRRLGLAWNVPAMWQAIDRGDVPPAPERAERPLGWLLWRRDLQTYWRSLDEDEAWAIEACAKGQDFGELCEGLCAWIEESGAAMHAAGMLKRWVTDGLIVRVVTG